MLEESNNSHCIWKCINIIKREKETSIERCWKRFGQITKCQIFVGNGFLIRVQTFQHSFVVKQFISKLKSHYLDVTQDKNHLGNCIYGVFWEEKNAWRQIEDEIWDNTKSHSDNIRAVLTIIILMRCWLFGFRLQQQLTSETNLFFVGWRKKYVFDNFT